MRLGLSKIQLMMVGILLVSVLSYVAMVGHSASELGDVVPMVNVTYVLGNASLSWKNISGHVNCHWIVGGSDTDFCADATGAAAGTNYWELSGEWMFPNQTAGGKFNANFSMLNITNTTGFLMTGTLDMNTQTIDNAGLLTTTMISAHNMSGNLDMADNNITNITLINATIWDNVTITVSQVSDFWTYSTNRSGDTLTGNFLITGWTNSSNFNGTYYGDGSNLIISTTYNASDVKTITGTHDDGDVGSIQTPEDSDSYNVSEASGTPSLDIMINYTNVSTFDSIIGRIYYEGGRLGHMVQLEIQRSDTGVWENYLDLTDMTDFVNIYAPVFDPQNHVFSDGNVSIRFYLADVGSPVHTFYIDYLAIVDGFTALTVSEHDSLAGRNSSTNHPWAMPTDASRNFTAGINVSGYVNATHFCFGYPQTCITSWNDVNVTNDTYAWYDNATIFRRDNSSYMTNISNASYEWYLNSTIFRRDNSSYEYTNQSFASLNRDWDGLLNMVGNFTLCAANEIWKMNAGGTAWGCLADAIGGGGGGGTTYWIYDATLKFLFGNATATGNAEINLNMSNSSGWVDAEDFFNDGVNIDNLYSNDTNTDTNASSGCAADHFLGGSTDGCIGYALRWNETEVANTTEEMQDACGALFSGGTIDGLDITYQDAANNVDFTFDCSDVEGNGVGCSGEDLIFDCSESIGGDGVACDGEDLIFDCTDVQGTGVACTDNNIRFSCAGNVDSANDGLTCDGEDITIDAHEGILADNTGVGFDCSEVTDAALDYLYCSGENLMLQSAFFLPLNSTWDVSNAKILGNLNVTGAVNITSDLNITQGNVYIRQDSAYCITANCSSNITYNGSHTIWW